MIALCMETGGFGYGDLFDHGRQIELDKGEILHRSEENCQALGMVLTGEIRLSRVLSTGKEIFLKDFRPGDLFAELIVFTGEQYPGWLAASEPSRIVEVKLSRVLEYLRGNDALVSYFAGISQKMAHLSNTIEVLSLKTVRQRIAHTLLCGKIDDLGVRVGASRLAAYIDCSREAVSRALTVMESDGLLERTPESLVIRDRKRLENLL